MSQLEYPTDWSKVTRKLKEVNQEREHVKKVLEDASSLPELKEVTSKLLELVRRYEELLIANPNKRVSVNIGDYTQETSLADSLEENEPAHLKVRKQRAKEIARKLYSKAHPDLGGTVESFRVIREAAKSGDLETLKFMSMSFDPDIRSESNTANLMKALEGKQQAFRGTASFKLAALYYANRGRFVAKCKEVLKNKIVNLEVRILGYTTYQSGAEDENTA